MVQRTGSLGAYQGDLPPRDQSFSLIFSRADWGWGGGGGGRNYELVFNQYKSHEKIFRQYAFLGDPPIFVPLGCKTSLRRLDLFFSWLENGDNNSHLRVIMRIGQDFMHALLDTRAGLNKW